MPPPQRNRVTPMGEIIAAPLHGSWMGNRGILHRGTDIVSFHRSNLWIICALQYKDWRAPQWQPGHYTVLFFHDEAVALAAGHRPCALCRRPAYQAFRTTALAATAGSDDGDRPATAQRLDRLLHSQRIVAGTHRRRLHPMPWTELPDGTFALVDDEPVLVLGAAIVGWSREGYGNPRQRPGGGTAQVITPPGTQAALTAGYPVQIHATARQLAGTLLA